MNDLDDYLMAQRSKMDGLTIDNVTIQEINHLDIDKNNLPTSQTRKYFVTVNGILHVPYSFILDTMDVDTEDFFKAEIWHYIVLTLRESNIFPNLLKSKLSEFAQADYTDDTIVIRREDSLSFRAEQQKDSQRLLNCQLSINRARPFLVHYTGEILAWVYQ